MARFLKSEAQRLDRTASLLAQARSQLRDRHILAPGESVLRRAVGAARQAARAIMAERMGERLSPALRERLDALLDTGDDDRFSALNRIKESSSSPSVGGMRRLLARLELIEATGVLGVDIGWVNGNYQRVLFHSVRVASADRLREMVTPRRHLALVCFLHQAWCDTFDQAVDMYAKVLERSRKLVESRLDDKLKAQRQAVDRIVHRYPALNRHGPCVAPLSKGKVHVPAFGEERPELTAVAVRRERDQRCARIGGPVRRCGGGMVEGRHADRDRECVAALRRPMAALGRIPYRRLACRILGVRRRA